MAVTAAARPYPDVCFAPLCSWFQEDVIEAGPPPSDPPAGPGGEDPFEDALHATEPVEPGLVWLTEADARGLAPAEQWLSYVLNLRLEDTLAGAALGVPAGLALFGALSGDEIAHPASWQLVAVVTVTVLVVAALTTVPARLGARRPAAETLQAELA